MKSSHAKRWITGIIAVPILFSIIYFSTEAVFAGFVLVVTVVAVLEYSRLAFGKEGITDAAGAAVVRPPGAPGGRTVRSGR